MSSEDPILKVNHLSTRFKTDRGAVTAVDRVSFDLFPGEVLGIVGESGCGKSVTNRSIMRLLPEYTSELSEESEILFDGHNLAHVPEKVMRTIRGNRIAMIFQEPMTALNPVFTIGWQIEEALKYHTSMNRAQRRERVLELLQLVEIPNPEKRINEYPHQLSGGMRQRIVIAMALACEPEILIADEPTTALDVTIQAQILRLMQDLQKKINTAIILITHDLGVVAQVCDRVIVMYAGQIVEVASVTELFHTPQHPYTRALLDSLPRPDATGKGQRLPAIEGIVPSLFELPEGCRFHQRCRFAQEQCKAQPPQLEEHSKLHSARCFFPLGE
ncbi:MAG: ABC transporter ATP-binding protein [Planctomycetota bacterium]|jgi:oligopeptide/dipeptide ABC transporter ATP-binding protein|nr:ABC transporter ATP-binding protein [Planctomycetota bacterium]MEC7448972.1 ABC transporter ATP-binding protein [Planctomycetota bacterium]MEC7718228.1 ABC transporter ATP-binding protein [Planctomycetota bacterium]MEC7979604.1 ABC transporter ATP-binding protein [Planctomycetota bacterium]MEC8240965.1 ABC transporter ATP-binding protein [Planctomycetota bacterium]